MKKITIILFLTIFWSSCQQATKEANKIQLVKAYVNALNDADFDQITSLFMDSICLKEMDYVSVFSKAEYRQIFQWDSTLQANYQILEIREENGAVRMQISKECPRILFLNEEPTITDAMVKFENGQIKSIEILNYVVFNDDKWDKNRVNLTSWIAANHSELNGFLHDQSEQGALNYLNAIELYQKKESEYLRPPRSSKQLERK